MAIPKATQTIGDGKLGLVSPSVGGRHVIVGYAAGGTPGTLYTYSSPDAAKAELLAGAALEKALLDLKQNGGPILVFPVAATDDGVAGSVTTARIGSSVGTLVVTGTPYDNYSVVVVFTAGQTNLADADAAYKLSLDGGQTFGPVRAFPADGVLEPANTGLTLTFSDASGEMFEAGDNFSFSCTPPAISSADLSDALDALLLLEFEAEFIHVIGQASTAGNSATIATMLATQRGAWHEVKRYVWFAMDAADTTDANLIAAFTSFADHGVQVGAGFVDILSPLDGRITKRPAGWAITCREAAIPLGQHPGRVKTGPLSFVKKLYRDEYKTEGLDAARFATLRTHPNRKGKYITRGKTMAELGSDYQQIQYLRVVLEGARLLSESILDYLNDDLVLNSDGTIEDGQASTIEKELKEALHDRLVRGKNASAVAVIVDRSNDLGTDQTLIITSRIRPKGYAEFIESDLAFAYDLEGNEDNG